MKRMKKRNLLLAVCIALLLTVTAGLTSAYIIARSAPVENVFAPGRVTAIVDEDFSTSVKNNVTLKNTGNVTARMRAQIVVTWKDADGKVYPALPAEGTDYHINMGTGWTQKEGLWYCDAPVAPGEWTPALIVTCQAVEGRAPEGYTLSVEILGEAIQAEPASAGWQ